MANATNVYKGIELILQYEEDAIFTSDSLQIWCGIGDGPSVNEITEEGVLLMKSIDWFIDSNTKTWSRYI